MDTGSEKASDNMIMLMVISATSLQIIPSTVIGMRIAHDALYPTAFLLPCIVSTVLSTVIGVFLVKIVSKITDKKKVKSKKHALLPLGGRL